MDSLLVQEYLWFLDRARGEHVSSIARRHGTTVRRVQAGVERARETGNWLIVAGIKVPEHEIPEPASLLPLLHMGGTTHREDVCPKHPGKRLVAVGVTAEHSNPEHRKWRNSQFVCLACMRSGQDHRIPRPPKVEPGKKKAEDCAAPQKPILAPRAVRRKRVFSDQSLWSFDMSKSYEAQIERAFASRPLKGDQPERKNQVRIAFRHLATEVVGKCPVSRELSAALTRLEEAEMFCQKAIAGED